MKTPRYICAPGLLALVLTLVTPVASLRAEDPATNDKLTKREQKYDADKDGQLSDEERARMKEDAKEKREEHRKEILAKYDANKNGKLDAEERAQMEADRKAEQDARKAEQVKRKAEREAKKEAVASTEEQK